MQYQIFSYMYGKTCGKIKAQRAVPLDVSPVAGAAHFLFSEEGSPCFSQERWWSTAPPACAVWRPSGIRSPAAAARTSPVTCSKCNGTGQVTYTQQSFFGGMIRNVQSCPDCQGKGRIIREKCPDCYGTGFISTRKKIKVTVPAGIDDGQSIRIRGKGDPGENGGERGDILVQVNVSKSPFFERQDMNIYSTVSISFADAALGGTIRIKTVDGEVEYDVKPGTQPGTKVRLKGKGVPSLRSSQVRGDHYVTLTISVPEKLNEEQREALIAFDQTMNGGTRREDRKKKKGLFK